MFNISMIFLILVCLILLTYGLIELVKDDETLKPFTIAVAAFIWLISGYVVGTVILGIF